VANATIMCVSWEVPLLLLTFEISWPISRAGLGRFERHHYASRLRSRARSASRFFISPL